MIGYYKVSIDAEFFTRMFVKGTMYKVCKGLPINSKLIHVESDPINRRYNLYFEGEGGYQIPIGSSLSALPEVEMEIDTLKKFSTEEE